MVLGLSLLPASSCYRAAPLDMDALVRELLDGAAVGTAKGAAAQDQRESVLVTEDEAAFLAWSGSGVVRSQKARASVARADVRRAKQIDNPELRVSNGWEEDGRLGQDVVQVSLRWSPRSLFRHLAEVDAARTGVPAAEAEVESVAWQARRDARRAWNRAALEGLRVQVERERVAIRQEVRDRLVATPGVDPVLMARAELALAQARDEVDDRRRRELESLGDLGRLLGRQDARTILVPVLESSLGCPVSPMPERTLADGAALRHPRVRAALADYDVAEAELKVAYARRIPWLRFVQIGWGLEDRNDRHRLRLGLGVDLPILDWNQGAIEAGKARRGREASQVRDAMSRVVGQLQDALDRWSQASQRLERLEGSLLPSATEAVRVTEEAVRFGRLTPIELSRVRLDALELRERQVQAALECRLAAIDAEYAAGAPLDPR